MTRAPALIQPSVQQLAAQILRSWRDNTLVASGLPMADVIVPVAAEVTAPCALYAGPMPERRMRREPCVAMEYLATIAREPMSPVMSYGFDVECRAGSRADAVATLMDFVRVFRPRGVEWVWVPSVDGASFDRRGVIGPPVMASGSPGSAVWRIIGIDIDREVTPMELEASAQSRDGSGSALVRVSVMAAPVTHALMPAPLPVLDVWHPTGISGVAEAQCRLVGSLGVATRLELRTRAVAGTGSWTTRTIDLAASANVSALRDAVTGHADAWTAAIDSAYDATVLERDPVPIGAYEPWPGGDQGWRPALGTASKQQIRVWA